MRSSLYAVGVLVLIVTVGCMPSPKSGQGFTLPDGNVEAGKATFISLQCNGCHKVSGVDQLAAEGDKPELSIELGGEVARIKTYGELVTAIINPSHRLAKGHPLNEIAVDGKSKMRNYNDVMTVTQLTDLVAFLQSKYRLREYEPTTYPLYGPY